MNDWYPRPVFFVKDVEASMWFYLERLGFAEDWKHEEGSDLIVAQVSCNGFELILNKKEQNSGPGRAFISLWDEHIEPLKAMIRRSGVKAVNKSWGMPVTEIADPDGNELLFSPQVL